MAEQLIERSTMPPPRHPLAPTADSTPHSDPTSAVSQDPLRDAMSYLERAGRRLKRGEGQQADEVLGLLQKATVHLQQAVDGHAERKAGHSAR